MLGPQALLLGGCDGSRVDLGPAEKDWERPWSKASLGDLVLTDGNMTSPAHQSLSRDCGAVPEPMVWF